MGRMCRFSIGGLLAGLMCWPAFLPAQNVVHVQPGDTLVIIADVVVPPPDTTPPVVPPDSLPYAKLLSVDDTIALIESAWADHPAAVRYDNYAFIEGVPGVLANDEDVTSPHTLTIQLQSTSIVAQVAANGRRADGSHISSSQILPAVPIALPPRQASIVVPPDTPPGTTPPLPTGGITIPPDHSHAGSNEPSGMTPAGLVDFSTGTLIQRGNQTSGNIMYDHSPSGASVMVGGGTGGGMRGGLISDPLSSGGQVLEFHMPRGCMNGGGHSCGNNIWARTRDKYRTMYIKYEVAVSDSIWVNKPGNKWIGQLGGTDNVPAKGANYHIKQSPNSINADWGQFGNIHIMLSEGGRHCGDSRNWHGSNAAFPKNQWMVVEVVVTASTGVCTPDGDLKLYLNGQLVVHAQNVPTYDPNGAPGQGAEWWQGVKVTPIMGGNCNPSIEPCPTAGHRLWFRQFYVSGKDQR